MSFGFSATNLYPKGVVDESISSIRPYGAESPMVFGLGSSRKDLEVKHPLERSEKCFHNRQQQNEMIMLRNTQGIHAPMRLAMELRSAEKIGRLPFLPSSNIMRDVILGRDEDIGFEDVLNTSEFREKMGQPHAVVEKSLGIL